MIPISIFSHTHSSFADHLFSLIGKGHQHAGLIYEEFFRTGSVKGGDPAFTNATALLEKMLSLIDFSHPTLAEEQSDGATGKVLLRTHDGLEIEAVLIPMQAGGTLCVSSQIGCRMGCAFCETGRMGLLRNLTVAEIVGQVFVARHCLGFDMRNIVFMGMGEPFDNYDNVMQAIRILCDPKGLEFGPRHITVSTSGSTEGIRRLIAEGEKAPNLAVSINAPTNEERNRLMPINKQHDMQQLHQAMQEYCQKTGRQILIAYVLLKDHNDTLEHAARLADYLKGLDVKINLIPYNPQRRDRFAAPEGIVVDSFALYLRNKGYRTLIRATKGQEIMAACGQLGNAKWRALRAQQLASARACSS